jgi:hypothetical protein
MVLREIKPLYLCSDLEKLDQGGKTVLENLFSQQPRPTHQEVLVVF